MTAQRADELYPGAPGTEPPDRDLAIAFKEGDGGAYRAIYDRYRSRVEGICRRMLHNPDDACEASQEAFLRIYQGLPRFNGRYQLAAWVTRIATNVCLDHIRARKRRPSDPAPVEEFDLDPDRVACLEPEPDPEVVYIRRAESRQVRAVLRNLPPLHRAAIVLRDFEGLSYEEIADALDLSPAQVKALLHRARQGFKRNWKEALVSALIPARLIQKLKGTEAPASSTGQQFAAHASQAACACTSMVQGAGVYFSERLATGVLATVIGGAAIAGGAVVTAADTTPPANRMHEQVVTGSTSSPDGSPDKRPGAATTEGSADTSGDQPSKSLEASPSPSPSATPSDGSGSGSGSGSEPPPTVGGGTGGQPAPPRTPGEPSPSPSPARPAYAPAEPAVGFDNGQILPSSPSRHDQRVDCAAMRLEQDLDILIYEGGKPYPATLSRINGTANDLTGRLIVNKYGQRVTYSLGAGMVSSSLKDDVLSLEYRGPYGLSSGDPERAGLPRGGIFRAKVTLDCIGAAVITERLTFSV